MKERFSCLLAMVLAVVFAFCIPAWQAIADDDSDNAMTSATENTSYDFLASTGMPTSEIESLSDEERDYITKTLLEGKDVNEDIVYIPSHTIDAPQTYGTEVLNNIEFNVQSFKNGDYVSIYPTYEFTDYKKPVGMDAFAFTMGDALIPIEYGGLVWYKDDYFVPKWTVAGPMIANEQFSTGAKYSGEQLGDQRLGSALKIRGNAYCKARIGNGDSRQFIASYAFNPSRGNLSIEVTVGGVGIQWQSDHTLYVRSQTVWLDF